ncbi:MAG: putative ABC transporter permease [Bacilli bacterium]|nr:putative ABC transporter permease [Bacilli bacterium]
MEVIMALIKEKKFINRGFLIGPIIPIWGAGAILITLILKPSDSIFNLIISSAFIGSFLEYVVNYLMEVLFKARWWDYSHLPFNVNGRIWLGSSLLFGLCGFLIIYYFNPFFLGIINKIDFTFLKRVDIVFFIILMVDLVISCNIINKLNLSAYYLKKDYTEEVSKKVKTILIEKSRSFKRLLEAFPDVNFFIRNRKN